MVGSLLIAALSFTLGAQNISPDEPGLRPEYRYNGVFRPLMIEVESPSSFGTVSLILMTHQGAVLGEVVGVRAGRVDLAELMPEVWDLRRAAYLQMMHHAEPVGSALVLDPMLSRMVPVTRDAVNPNGIQYTEIIGWRDESDPPPPPEPAQAEDAETDEDQSPDQAVETDAVPDTTAESDRLITGIRMYVEQDVLMHTDHGDMHFALRPDQAPNTAWNFLELCAGGFYRDVVFHRIVPLTRNGEPFVIQAGDPSGTGEGGPGYWLPLERSELLHDFGVISMARDVHPDSAGSQFFVCLSREGTARLDGHYCAFGYTVDGAETIKRIAEVELDDVQLGRPRNPPRILTTELMPAPPRLPGVGRPDSPVSVEDLQPVEPPQPKRQPR